jgi:hypothetical protein
MQKIQYGVRDLQLKKKNRNLLKALTQQNCNYLSTGVPTYWPTDPNKMADLLDFFINKGETPNYIQVEPNFELWSDHTPVIAALSSHIISKPASPTLTSKNTDWNSVRKYLEKNINLEIRIKEPNELDEAVQNFTTLTQQAAWHSTPVPTEKLKEMDNIPLYVEELGTEKRRARNRWQRTRNTELQ